jgi:hypothetical protein
MLGENAIRFFDLDRDHLAEIAARIGPTVGEILGPNPPIRPELVENFEARGGYLKPAEGDEKIPEVGNLVEQDLAVVGGA